MWLCWLQPSSGFGSWDPGRRRILGKILGMLETHPGYFGECGETDVPVGGVCVLWEGGSGVWDRWAGLVRMVQEMYGFFWLGGMASAWKRVEMGIVRRGGEEVQGGHAGFLMRFFEALWVVPCGSVGCNRRLV